MTIHADKLLPFAIQLIDIQIKKYNKLATIGVGPDALVSAELIKNQVTDLIQQLEALLNRNTPSQEELIDFASTLEFYLQCEYLRGRAGWLLDENKIHNTVYERVTGQLEELAEIDPEQNRKIDPLLTPFQEQYLHDSHEVAYRILHLVARLVEDPERTDLGKDNNLGHGLVIMRKHAKTGGRYHNPEISKEIQAREKESGDFIEASPFSKSTKTLNKDGAQLMKSTHQEQLKQCIQLFREKHPDSTLALQDFSKYEVAQPVATSNFDYSKTLKQVGLFALGTLSVVAASYACYAASSDDPVSFWPGA